MNFRTSRRGGLQRLLLAGAIGLTTLSAPAFSAPTPVKGGTIRSPPSASRRRWIR